MKEKPDVPYGHLYETQIESVQVHRGRLLDLRIDRVRLPDGSECSREYVRHQGAAVIIPLLSNGELLFERQFRYPLKRAFLELPAGKIDPGESPLQTATRELLEETGHIANQWRHLGVMHPCIGYSNERIEIFLASELSIQTAYQREPGEFLDLLSLSLDSALEQIRDGTITDAKTICALFWAEKILRSGW